MADIFSKKKRSEVMSAIRSRRNKSTELALASALRRAGINGWRRHLPLPGRPDFAFPKLKLAVFVDGCFWHGCPKHGQMPKTNIDFWKRKIRVNRRRDKKAVTILRGKGWEVIRFWEHDTRKALSNCVSLIETALDQKLVLERSQYRKYSAEV
jgi:DNA mismatch endonuclease (patch repair protein)